MKKVLIIGSIWPYHHGGARVPGLAKYISEYGWEPIVLTQPLPENLHLGYRVVETPYVDMLKTVFKMLGFDTNKSIQKQIDHKVGGATSRKSFINPFFLLFRDILTYPELNKGWKSPAVVAGEELIRKEKIDAIISASPPITSSLIARELKERYNMPWIADFPHLWSQNNAYPYGSLRKTFDVSLEKKTLSDVDGLTTTSEPLAETLNALHKGKKIHVITHGFDPDTVRIHPDRLTSKFSITYTGGWHPIFREPSMLLRALNELILEGTIQKADVEVRFYGNKEHWIDCMIKEYNLCGIVKQLGRVPMDEAQTKQTESHLLFNPKWDEPNYPGIHSLKIFEYLAARRPILATGKYHDVVDDLLDETKAGICAKSVEDTKRIIDGFYSEYKRKGMITYGGNIEKINKYSHREMARKFAETLDDLV